MDQRGILNRVFSGKVCNWCLCLVVESLLVLLLLLV